MRSEYSYSYTFAQWNRRRGCLSFYLSSPCAMSNASGGSTPKLDLERFVYEHQFGAFSHGVGGANNVFFAGTKLAFGWRGAVCYCAIIAVCAAAVDTSDNIPVMLADITSLYAVSVSAFTVMLLSGGLLFFVALALVHPSAVALSQRDRR